VIIINPVRKRALPFGPKAPPEFSNGINAHEEFSPPKLGLITKNDMKKANIKRGCQARRKAGTPLLPSEEGKGVIMINGIKAKDYTFSLLFFAGFEVVDQH